MPASITQVDSAWRVSADLEPGSREDRWGRAIFFATIISIESARLLVHCLNYCLGGASPGSSAAGAPMERNREALKEITCQSIYLSLIEQDGMDAPAWLKEFISDSFAAADKIHERPPAKAILEKYAAEGGVEGNCLATSANICHQLGLGDKKADAIIYLGNCLKEQAPLRASCLSFALRASERERDQVIKDSGGRQDDFPEFEISDSAGGA